MVGAINPHIMNATEVDVAGALKFEISTRKKRDGFTLGSTILLFPLWYETLNEAVSYARFLGRDRGCEIRIRNSKGGVIDEIKIGVSREQMMNPLRLMRFARRGASVKLASKRSGKKNLQTFQYTALETA